MTGGAIAKRVLLVAGILAFLAFCYLFPGFIIARAQVGQAADAFNQANTDITAIDAMLSDNTVANSASTGQDPAAIAASLDTYFFKLKAAEQTIATDQSQLTAAKQGLEGGWLTAPESGQLQKRRFQIDHTQAAFSIAKKALEIAKTQIGFLEAFSSAVSDFGNAGTAMNAHDLGAARADFLSASSKFQQCTDLARSPDLPPQFGTELSAFSRASTDGKALVEAVQAGDQAGSSRWAAALKADGPPLTDSAGIKVWLTNQYGALHKSFKEELAKAAG